MDFSSFSADLLQVVLGLPRCLFPSGVQNNPSLETLLGSPLSTCPIHVHFLRVKLTMMSLFHFLGHLRSFSTFKHRSNVPRSNSSYEFRSQKRGFRLAERHTTIREVVLFLATSRITL